MGHGGLFRVFSFTCVIRSSGHVQVIYPQGVPKRPETGFLFESGPAILRKDSLQINNSRG